MSAFVTLAQAEVVRSPTRALELLTRARLAAAHCGWLDETRRQELTQLAAQAELLAIRRAGPVATRQAFARGKKAARGCDSEQRALVEAVYEGAHEAALASARAQNDGNASRRRTLSRVHRQGGKPRPRARLRAAAWEAPVSRASAPEGMLSRYRLRAAAYYHALKCRNRSRAELMRMWEQVRKLHYAVLRVAGSRKTARAKAAAARKGTARTCL